ncbi:MAG: hypothetical protein ACRDY1_08645 [Acidimicrobiales bacterium]
MRLRTIAAGVTLAAVAGAAVPLALSGTASAKGSGTPATMSVTKCSPTTATVGKTVTIHGTLLTGATKVTIGGTNVTASITKNTARAVKINPVPKGVTSSSGVTVKVTANGTTASTTCTFKKPAKKKAH